MPIVRIAYEKVDFKQFEHFGYAEKIAFPSSSYGAQLSDKCLMTLVEAMKMNISHMYIVFFSSLERVASNSMRQYN